MNFFPPQSLTEGLIALVFLFFFFLALATTAASYVRKLRERGHGPRLDAIAEAFERGRLNYYRGALGVSQGAMRAVHTANSVPLLGSKRHRANIADLEAQARDEAERFRQN